LIESLRFPEISVRERLPMKNVAVALVLVVMTTAVYAQTTPKITPPTNGEEWMKLSSTEKLFWSIGYAQGYLEALNKIDVAAGPNSACANMAAQKERASSSAGKVTGFELVSGLEKFYSDPANLPIPIGSAIRIYLLQASGKDQTAIQELIETARTLGAQSTKRAQK
jgi:hypothetical protein